MTALIHRFPKVLDFDAIVKQNENAKRTVFSKYTDLVPKILRDNNEKEENMYSEEEKQKKITETKHVFEKIVNPKSGATQPKSPLKVIKYRPSQTSVAFNSGAKERIIRMVEKPVDAFDPPKFRHKRVPKAFGEPPVPVLHSPPRPLSLADKKEWSIPPCISQFKNPKGYTIPLDKREVVDGRRLQDVQISDKHAHLHDSLYVAYVKSKEEVDLRAKVRRELKQKEKEKEEQKLRDIARSTRAEAAAIRQANGEKNTAMEIDETKEERLKRDEIRREMKRERRLTKNKRSRDTRDSDRDVSEKVALGIASGGVGGGKGEEIMHDQRLFNQQRGMDSGFGNDDQYNVYQEPLFTTRSTFSSLHRPKKDVDADTYGGADEQLEKIMKTDRFKPHEGFEGTTEKAGPRNGPVEFDVEEADPFGLDNKAMENMKKAFKARGG